MASAESNNPPQHQDVQPGIERDMEPRTRSFMEDYRPAGKLRGRVAIVTSGDSDIGRVVSIGGSAPRVRGTRLGRDDLSRPWLAR